MRTGRRACQASRYLVLTRRNVHSSTDAWSLQRTIRRCLVCHVSAASCTEVAASVTSEWMRGSDLTCVNGNTTTSITESSTYVSDVITSLRHMRPPLSTVSFVICDQTPGFPQRLFVFEQISFSTGGNIFHNIESHTTHMKQFNRA